MIRRILLVAAAAVTLILAPSVATAVDYDAPPFSASVSDSTPAIGQPVTVTIDGGAANAGQMIKLVITSDAGITMTFNKRANANGVVKFTFKLSAAGRYTVEAFNAAGVRVSRQVLTVPSEANSPLPPKLSHTGFEGMPLAVGGGLLVLVGAGGVVVARRRRSAQVPA